MNLNPFAVDRETDLDRLAAKVGSLLQDFPSHNTFDDYLRLADELDDASRCRVLRGREFCNAPADPEHVTVFLRHDMDCVPYRLQSRQ